MRTVVTKLAFDLEVFERRLERLEGRQVFLGVSSDCEWLTGVPRLANDPGFDSHPGAAMSCLLVGPSGPVFVAAHSQWALEAGAAMADWDIVETRPSNDATSALRTAAERAGWDDDGTVHVGAATQYRQVEMLRNAFPDRDLRSAGHLFEQLRYQKDEHEVAALRDVAQLTGAAIRSACSRLRHGVGRRDLLDAVTAELLEAGADCVPYGPDLWATGPKVAVDWATPTTWAANPPLTAPCSVSIDMGVRLRGYSADLGRTIFVGEPQARSLEALEAIRAAREIAKPFLRTGTRACDIDIATREVIDRRGFSSGFWIPSGHGIGLDLHEPPTLGDGDCRSLEDGSVVTLELAIWQDGGAGAFAEDMLVVRDDGPEWLTSDAAEPVVIA